MLGVGCWVCLRTSHLVPRTSTVDVVVDVDVNVKLFHCPHDEGERRPDVVRGINEKAHLCLFQVTTALALKIIEQQEEEASYNEGIEQIGPPRQVPRLGHIEM